MTLFLFCIFIFSSIIIHFIYSVKKMMKESQETKDTPNHQNITPNENYTWEDMLKKQK